MYRTRSSFFCALGLIIKKFPIIYIIPQQYYDNKRSPESWNWLLMSPLADNNGGACGLRLSVLSCTTLKHGANLSHVT